MPYPGMCRSCMTPLAQRLALIPREVQAAMEAFRENEALRLSAADQLRATETIPRELREALEETHRAGLHDAISATVAESKRVQQMLESLQPPQSAALEVARHHLEPWRGLPAADLDRIGSQLRDGLDAVSRQAALAAFRPGYEELATMAARARPAWEELAASQTASYAFAAMASLREAIERAPFAEPAIAALRSQLGDWSAIRLSAELFDQQQRQEVYRRVGFDARLVAVAPATFDAMLGATELRPAKPPPLRRIYVSADLIEIEDDEELERAAEDYRVLYRFESQLRGFVADVLSKEAGSDWVKQRVPPDCLKNWRDRREKDRKAKKHVHPLLSYADLGDWSKIIQRNDNWPLFEPIFRRKVLVEAAFIRLIPLRNDVAHMRPLTEADRLVFYAEIQQLWVAIRKPQDDEDEDWQEVLQLLQ